MTYKSKNGITIKCTPQKSADSACILLKLRGGIFCEPRERRGMAHLTEHMCYRAFCGMSLENFYYEIEKIGAFLRGMTFRDCTAFEMTVAPKYFARACELIRGLFCENSWTKEDIRREKNVVLRQIENSAGFRKKQLDYDFFCRADEGEPIIGTKTKVGRTTENELRLYKKEMFSPERAEIYAVGNIDESLLVKTFEDIHAVNAKEPVFNAPVRFCRRNRRDIREYDDGEYTSALCLSFDIAENGIIPRVIESALCRGLLSPLSMCLREKLGIIDEPQSGLESYPFGGMLWMILETDIENGEKLLHNTERIIKESAEKLSPRATECAKAAFFERAAYMSPCDFAYVRAFEDDFETPEEYANAYKNLSEEDIQTAAKKLFSYDNLTLAKYNI